MSWETLQSAAAADKFYLMLLDHLGSGSTTWDGELEEFRKYADKLTVVQGVVLYDGRVFVRRCFVARCWERFTELIRGLQVWG